MSSVGEISCWSTCHDTVAAMENSEKLKNFVSVDNRHIFNSELLNKCQREGLLRETRHGRKLYVCKACICYITGQSSLENRKRGRSQDSESDTITCRPAVLDLVSQASTLNTTELAVLAEAIGHRIKEDLKKRATEPTEVEARRKAMAGQTYDFVWENQNVVLKRFLGSIVEYKNKSISDKRRCITYMVKSVENIYCALNSYFISPLALSENLVVYYNSGSKYCCDILGNCQASGHYRTVLNTAHALGNLSPKFPSCDILCAFDNNQIVRKQYRVACAGKQPESTVTSISVFFEDNHSKQQQEVALPTTFLTPVENPEEIWRVYSTFLEEANAIHRKFRKQFIEDRMVKVYGECKVSGGNISDSVSEELSSGISKYTPLWGTGLNYDRVKIRGRSCSTVDQECLTVNPNSSSSVKKIFDHILQKSEESGVKRKWLVVICDGLPFGIGNRIIKNTFDCPECHTPIHRSDVKDHCGIHEGQELKSKSFLRKYKEIILRPGNGHYEITLVRAIFKTYFDVLLKPVAEILGFRTPLSLDYCRKAHDHHKSWQILQIVYEALVDEILYAFVSNQLKEPGKPNIDIFMQWHNANKNPNYLLASHFVFSVLHPLFLFRAAIRQCNDQVALAAREKSSVLFYGLNNPKYREINANDVFYLLSLPKKELNLVRNQSMRRGKSNFGQGMDFLLEERNKAQKGWVIYDGPTPSAEQWRRASCSTDELDKIKSAVYSRLGMTEHGSEVKNVDISKEIHEVRKHFRRKNLIYSSDECPMLTYDEEKISSDFLNFIPICEENREKYYKAFCRAEKCDLRLMSPKPTHSASNLLSSNDIVKLIRNKLSLMPEVIQKHYKKNFDKTASKNDLLEFLNVLDEELEEIEWREAQEYSHDDLFGQY